MINPEKSVLTNETEPVTEPTQESTASSNAEMINLEKSVLTNETTCYRTYQGTSGQCECSNDQSREVSFDERNRTRYRTYQKPAASSNAEMINRRKSVLTNEIVTELLFNSDDDDSPEGLQKEKRNRPKRDKLEKCLLCDSEVSKMRDHLLNKHKMKENVF